MSIAEWKQAQNKVSNAMKVYMDACKDFYGKSFTDTYAARGEFVQAQPSDMWFIAAGRFAILEVKSSHSKDKFYFSDVQPSQWVGARRVTAAGGVSLFILAQLPGWQWFLVDGRDMIARKTAGDKGIKWVDMTPIELTMVKILAKMYEFYKI